MKQRWLASLLAVSLLAGSPAAALAADAGYGGTEDGAIAVLSEEEAATLSETAAASEETMERTDGRSDEGLAPGDGETAQASGGAARSLSALGESWNGPWKFNEKSGELTITAKGMSIGSEDSSAEDYPWHGLKITRLTVKSATEIGRSAFDGCASLETVQLPDTLTSIGVNAFADCAALKSIVIPDHVQWIGDGAFYGCSSLESVKLPKHFCGIKKDDAGDSPHVFPDPNALCEIPLIFEGCPLKSIQSTGNQYLTASNHILFSNKKTVPGLMLLLYPAGSAATSYRIPDEVTEVCDYAFDGCRNLKQLQLGRACVPEIGNGHLGSLQSFAVDAENPKYAAPGGVLYSRDRTRLIAWPTGREDKSYVTSASCSDIAPLAFAGSRLEKLGITSGVTYLPGFVITGSKALKELVLPSSLTRVDEDAMSDCDALADIYYTGTREQWASIQGMEQAMREAFGDNPPTIHYNAAPPTPSAEEDVTFVSDGSGGTGGAETGGEDVSNLAQWTGAANLKDGATVSVSLYYTPSTTFDGRKHVLSVNPAKNTAVKATASVNPDIEVKGFTVEVDGARADGITLKSCSFKNNTNPGEMQMMPAVSFGKDEATKALLKEHKDLKTLLGKLFKPSYKYDKEAEDYNWTPCEPILITIAPISLDGSTEVCNLKVMSKAEVAKKDGVLVWNGKPEQPQKITYAKRTYKEAEEEDDNGRVTKWTTYTYYIPTKAVVPGLYYQRVFDLGNGRTAVKKISLKAGGWTLKKTTYSEDGEKYVEYSMVPASGACDYYCAMPDVEGSEEKATELELVVNAEGRTVTKMKKVRGDYDEDTKRYEYDWEEYEAIVAKPGNFTGTLPSFN